jgi:hypothetical protein
MKEMKSADFYLMSYDSDYTTGQAVWVSILVGAKKFSLLQDVHIGSGTEAASYSAGTVVLSWR